MVYEIVALAEAVGPCCPSRGILPETLGTVYTESDRGPQATAILRIWGRGDQWLVQRIDSEVPAFATVDATSPVGLACTTGALGAHWVVSDRYGTGRLYARRRVE
tara:strand:- start:1034 stop:1348 length:315 start_codon:yes stop_codon:yes gene_type:complete